jgi:hypothetical protein
MKPLTLALTACCLLVAGSVRAADVTSNDLKIIGLAYHNYFDKNKKGPAKAEDLKLYLGDKKEEVEKLLDLLTTKKVVFIYNVGLFDMTDGTSNTVLAYEKDIAKNGGLALYGDGSVKKLSADDFKKAIIAKPKKKDK